MRDMRDVYNCAAAAAAVVVCRTWNGVSERVRERKRNRNCINFLMTNNFCVCHCGKQSIITSERERERKKKVLLIRQA
jgi:hypothetical protein